MRAVHLRQDKRRVVAASSSDFTDEGALERSMAKLGVDAAVVAHTMSTILCPAPLDWILLFSLVYTG